jgi:hypothetical protein
VSWKYDWHDDDGYSMLLLEKELLGKSVLSLESFSTEMNDPADLTAFLSILAVSPTAAASPTFVFNIYLRLVARGRFAPERSTFFFLFFFETGFGERLQSKGSCFGDNFESRFVMDSSCGHISDGTANGTGFPYLLCACFYSFFFLVLF